MSVMDPLIDNDRIKLMRDLGDWRDKTLLNYFDKAMLIHSNKPAVIGYLKESETKKRLVTNN